MASPSMNAPNGRPIVWQTEIEELPLKSRGKVRDLYDAGDKLLLIASDRLSAFDVVLPTPIPDKGRVLTQLSLFWFDQLRDVIPNHVISATEFPAGGRGTRCRARRPHDALPQDATASRGMRGARISRRIGLEGLSKNRRKCAASRCLAD